MKRFSENLTSPLWIIVKYYKRIAELLNCSKNLISASVELKIVDLQV